MSGGSTSTAADTAASAASTSPVVALAASTTTERSMPPVPGHDDLEAVDSQLGQRVEIADLVVAAGQHAEQWPGMRGRGEQPARLEHRRQWQRAGDEGVLVRAAGGAPPGHPDRRWRGRARASSAATSARLRSISGRSNSRWRTPRAVLAIAGWRRCVASITRSRASRRPVVVVTVAVGGAAFEECRDDRQLVVASVAGRRRVASGRRAARAGRSSSSPKWATARSSRSTNHVGMPSRSGSSDRR